MSARHATTIAGEGLRRILPTTRYLLYWESRDRNESHAKDAELGLRDRSVQRRGQAEREDSPRIERVDDPVVPESRGRVVRIALVLVLRRDLVGIGVAD